MRNTLDYLFNPSSLAVIGASDKVGSLGRGLAENILSTYTGKIYFVNRRGGKILGLEAFRSVKEISDIIDLALIITPSHTVPEILDELREKETKVAVIYSGGFREAGREDLEREVIEKAKINRIRILGPNCVGFIDNWTPINATFVSRERQGIPRKGYVSLISQSGALGSLFLDLMSYRDIGLRRFISVGNASDIKISELIRYLVNDPDTRALGLYIESIAEGRELIESLRKFSSVKPIVILRGGRSSRGSKAALSHVAALSASPKLVDGVLRISGITQVYTIREFLASMEALEKLERLLSLEKIFAITNTGGMGVLVSDALDISGIELTDFLDNQLRELRSIVPPYMSIGNPIDLSGDAPTERFREVFKILIKYKPDLLIIINQPQTSAMDTENFVLFAEELRNYLKDLRILLLVSGGEYARNFASRLRKIGLPVAEDPHELVAMIRSLRKDIIRGVRVVDLVESRREMVNPIVLNTLLSGRNLLLEYESKEILSRQGLDIPKGFVARSLNELKDLFYEKKLVFPVVAKIVSPDITHKSSIGGVVLGIRNFEELEKAFINLYELARNRGIRFLGVLVEEMIRGSPEFFVGGYRHEVFGSVVSFGSGGVFVELLEDVAFRSYDADIAEIYSMISETMIFRLLSRIEKKEATLSSIIKTIGIVSRLLEDNPEIKEIDINPATLYQEKVYVLDARIILGNPLKSSSVY
ncbi:MAG: acetate--CoA ligase family protein [Sulfolobales archaeon]